MCMRTSKEIYPYTINECLQNEMETNVTHTHTHMPQWWIGIKKLKMLLLLSTVLFIFFLLLPAILLLGATFELSFERIRYCVHLTINIRNPPKSYRPFCARHLYGTFLKYDLLRLQLTVSPSTKLRTFTLMRDGHSRLYWW